MLKRPPSGSVYGSWTVAGEAPRAKSGAQQVWVTHRCGTRKKTPVVLSGLLSGKYTGNFEGCCPSWALNKSVGGYYYITFGNHMHGGFWALEHRYIMDNILWAEYGIRLDPNQTVHHIDGDRRNNRPENLQVRWGHHGEGATYRCCDCGSGNVAPAPLAEVA